MAMWWASVVLLSLTMVWLSRHSERRTAFGKIALISLIVPVWILLSRGDLPIDVRVGITFFGLLFCSVDYRTLAYRHWVLSDWAVLGLCLLHFVSDIVNDGFSWVVLIRASGEWSAAYVVGRWSVVQLSDLRPLQGTACSVAIVLGLWSVSESVTGVNVANLVIEERPEDNTPHVQLRWGFKRAEGPTMHPIWFGMVQVLLTPWVLQAGREAIRGTGPLWRIAAAPIGAAGIFFTMSRGPWLVYLFTCALTAACMYRVRPRYILATIAIVGVVGFLASDAVVQALHWTTSRDLTKSGQKVVVEGEKVDLNETTHRLLLFKVYRTAMLRAGLIGFGTDRTTGFPVRVPVGQLDPVTMQRVRNIDSEYILIQLRFGLVGVVLLATVFLSTGMYGVLRAYDPDVPARLFSAAQGGVLLGVALVFWVEYMPYDYSFPAFWTAGIAASLRERGYLTARVPAPHVSA